MSLDKLSCDEEQTHRHKPPDRGTRPYGEEIGDIELTHHANHEIDEWISESCRGHWQTPADDCQRNWLRADQPCVGIELDYR